MAEEGKPNTGGKRSAVGLQIKLPVANPDELVTRYGGELGEGALFVRTRTPKPVGTLVRFDFRYAEGASALRGVASVKVAIAETENAQKPGMLLQFLGFEAASHELLRTIGRPSALPVLKAPAVVDPVADARTSVPPPRSSKVEPPSGPATPPIAAASPGSLGPSTPRTAKPKTPEPAADPLDILAFAGDPEPELPPEIAQAPVTRPPAPAEVKATRPGEPALGPSGEFSRPKAATRRLGPVVGIDLGTTNSCVAWMHHGKPQVIPSREGYNTVPSVFAINDRGKMLVGHPAKSQLLTNPRHTVYGAKRLIGRPFVSPIVSQLREHFPYEIVEGPRGEAAVSVAGKTFTLQEVSALILKEVREVARGKLGQDVTRAVITVPAHYNDHQRQAVREAGELAGLHVEQIINEPTAAALAFGHGRNLEQRVLVYDLGGGTFDVSVLELHGGNIYEVVSTGGDTFLGGVDFDLKILEVLLQRFEAMHGIPFDGERVALQRMLDAAERAKMSLSEANETHVLVPFVSLQGDKPLNLDVRLKRAELEQATAFLIDRTLQVTADVLAARKLKPTDIDEVLLVGGQSRMPLVRDRLRAFFGKEPNKGVHPDEAVALGAAVLANSIATEQADSLVLIDVLPMSIGVGLPGGRFKRIIERNTTVPHTRTHTIATTRDDQTSLEIQIFQGEHDRAAENEFLGSITLEKLPKALRGSVKIDVTFKLSKEALLTVHTLEGESGAETRMVLATRDTPEQVRKKLADLDPPPPEKGGILGFFKRLFSSRKN